MFVTGGTFDKEYDELTGKLYFRNTHVDEMLRRGRGHLAAVSSMAAYKGLPGESGYTSSKAAVNNFMEGLRIQLRGRGIAVTTICPGFVRTPMTEHRIKNPQRRQEEFTHIPWHRPGEPLGTPCDDL